MGAQIRALMGAQLGARKMQGTTFGIFLWLQVMDFNGFLFLYCFWHGWLSFYLGLFCYLCWITGTEQQLTSANDILFWNQVIEADQLFLPTLWPLLGGRILFIPRCVHFGRRLPRFVPSWFVREKETLFVFCHEILTKYKNPEGRSLAF